MQLTAWFQSRRKIVLEAEAQAEAVKVRKSLWDLGQYITSQCKVTSKDVGVVCGLVQQLLRIQNYFVV